jgi:hypothetical protein
MAKSIDLGGLFSPMAGPDEAARHRPPGDPEARALRATCVAALKRRIEHDALGRAGEHRAIRVGRAGEGIDIRGQDRERP